MRFPQSFLPQLTTTFQLLNNSFNISNFTNNRSNFLTISRAISIVSSLRVIHLTIRFNRHIRTFSSDTMNNVNFLTNHFNHTNSSNDLLTITINRRKSRFLVHFLRSRRPSFRTNRLRAIHSIFRQGAIRQQINQVKRFTKTFFFFQIIIGFFRVLSRICRDAIFDRMER